MCLFTEKLRVFSLSLVIAAQAFYVILFLLVKPFQEWVDDFVELINGVMLIFHLVILYGQDNNLRWDDGIDGLYISLIVLTVLIDTFLIISTGLNFHYLIRNYRLGSGISLKH